MIKKINWSITAFWNIVTTGKCNSNSSDDAVVFIECKCEKTGEK